MSLLEFLHDLLLFAAYVGTAHTFPGQLSLDEEAEYLERLAQGDPVAREKLITHNLRLVAHIAKKYAKAGRDADDIISIGTIGLIKAVSTYDLKKGVPLSSYASRCIENEILMSIRQERKQVLEVSIHEAIGVDTDGNDVSFSDILGSDPDMIVDEVQSRMESELVRNILDNVLTERERKVIVLRYGLIGGYCMAQREVARILGISRSYVSRIEKKALATLNQALKKQL